MLDIKKTLRWIIICLNEVYKLCILLGSYKNVCRKSSAKRECHDENVFLKTDRALSKLNFSFACEIRNKSTNFEKM